MLSTNAHIQHATVVSDLPSPGERPDADVVIYDGNCRICTSQVARIASWDHHGRLAFLSLHDPAVAQRYPDLNHDALMRDMYIVDRNERRYRGAEAVRLLSRKLPHLWWLAPLLHLPFSMPLWQWLYRRLADIRYRFGRLDSCDEGRCSVHARRS